MLRKIITATILTLAISGHAYAACLPAELCTKISGITDVPLGVWGGVGDLTTNYTLCIYVQNDNESNYAITGSGTGAGGEYVVSNGTEDVTVTVDWEEDSDPSWVNLINNTATQFPNPHTTNENCVGGGGNSAKIRVTIPSANMDFATSGAYSGTITLLSSPD